MPNYIRVKQLDSQELSGFFTSISVEDIFNKASSGQFVNTTGNQTISDIKTFTSRPTVNGTGVLLIGEIATLPNTIVFTTGDQTISGVKTFNLQPILSGNPLITGVNLSSYATATNLQSTGSTLLTNINSLSGTLTSTYATITNLASTGTSLINNINSLSGSAVLTYGNQSISGVKTFFNSGIFSTSGASAVSLLNNPLSIVGSGNSYLQVNIQNRATGTNATADLVITANNGTDSTNFINLGINNSGYNDSNFSNGTGLDGYLFINGGDLDIGTQTPGKNIEFHVGGTTAANAIARITSSGLGMVNGYILSTVNTGVVAGTDAQGQGPLTSQVNIITTNASPTGAVTLPTVISGFSAKIMVRNTTVNSLNIYPAAGARIDALAVNSPFGSSIAQNNNKEFYSVFTGQWYSI